MTTILDESSLAKPCLTTVRKARQAYCQVSASLTEHTDCLKHTFSAANWPRVSAMATFPVTLRAALSGQTLAEVEARAAQK